MHTIRRVIPMKRHLLGASLALCLAPMAGAQALPPGRPGGDAPPPILDPSIPYIASGLSGRDDLDLGPNDLHLTEARDTYAGKLSGEGGLHILGGNQTLTGTNTYAGGTTVGKGTNTFAGGTLIEGGTVRVEQGSSLGTGEVLLRGGTLEAAATLITEQPLFASGESGVNVHPEMTATLAGDLLSASTDACFAKSGAGDLRLTGDASLAGGACVQEGLLMANGDIASPFLRVDAPATLRGMGVIHAPVSIEGRLAAGDGPGTLHVEGAVTLQTGATLQVDIDGDGMGHGAGNYSRVVVTGEANPFVADGTLAPVLRGMGGGAANTFTPALGSTYRIVEAEGGVTGRFTYVEQPAEGLAANTRFLAFYGTNDGRAIDLRVAPASYARFIGVSAKRNSVAAANTLDRLISAQDAGTANPAQTSLLYTVSAADGSRVGRLVSRLSGEVHAGTAAAARHAGLGLQRDVADHLATEAGVEASSRRAWVNVAREGGHTLGDGHGHGYDARTGRGIVGVDLFASGGTVAGIAVARHDTDLNATGGSGRISGNAGIVYAEQELGAFFLDGVATLGRTDWTSRRADPLDGGPLASHSNGKYTLASATLRRPIHTRRAYRIEPYASVVWQRIRRDAVTEHGESLAALSLGKLTAAGTRLAGGVALGSRADEPLLSSATWRAAVGVGVDRGELLAPTVDATLAGVRFPVKAARVGRAFAQIETHATARVGKRAYLYGGLRGEARARGSSYGATAGVRVAM